MFQVCLPPICCVQVPVLPANELLETVFFIVFRETLETSIIVSILLAFLRNQLGPQQDVQVYKKLRKQVSVDTQYVPCDMSNSYIP